MDFKQGTPKNLVDAIANGLKQLHPEEPIKNCVSDAMILLPHIQERLAQDFSVAIAKVWMEPGCHECEKHLSQLFHSIFLKE